MTGSFPLELDAVTKAYGKPPAEVVAVSNVSFRVEDGSIAVILGPSGSGKTTLLSIAGCLLKPTSGRVQIMARDVTTMSERQLPAIRLQHIGFVFQAFNLLEPLSALENVLMPMQLAEHHDASARKRAHDLLTELGLEHRLGSRPSALSAGEKQRVAIARALANRPDIVLADEPTANLDSHAGQHVMSLLSGLVKQGEARALIVVTHDTRVVDFADTVLWMQDGQLSGNAPSTRDPLTDPANQS